MLRHCPYAAPSFIKNGIGLQKPAASAFTDELGGLTAEGLALLAQILHGGRESQSILRAPLRKRSRSFVFSCAHPPSINNVYKRAISDLTRNWRSRDTAAGYIATGSRSVLLHRMQSGTVPRPLTSVNVAQIGKAIRRLGRQECRACRRFVGETCHRLGVMQGAEPSFIACTRIRKLPKWSHAPWAPAAVASQARGRIPSAAAPQRRAGDMSPESATPATRAFRRHTHAHDRAGQGGKDRRGLPGRRPIGVDRGQALRAGAGRGRCRDRRGRRSGTIPAPASPSGRRPADRASIRRGGSRA
jgi:hypothetical protein